MGTNTVVGTNAVVGTTSEINLALVEQSHAIEDIAKRVDALAPHARRPLSLIAESDMNNPRLITTREGGGYGLTGQWSDDFHHALYVSLTGDTTGYYADFADPQALPKTWHGGFYHDGTWSSFRCKNWGAPVPAGVPSWRFVEFAQDHDQIGNRAAGDRLSQTLSIARLQVAAVLTMTAPGTPMLFMGEEWGASTPWQFFTSHPEPELAAATRKGRTAEFAAMGWDESLVPDPNDPATFERSKLHWAEASEGDHLRLLEGYRALARLRRERPEDAGETDEPDLGGRESERRRGQQQSQSGPEQREGGHRCGADQADLQVLDAGIRQAHAERKDHQPEGNVPQ